jgi:hypothetical protein
MTPLLRVGTPDATGAIPAELARLGRPALLSVSALWDLHHRRFTRPPAGLRALDIALDSAGFVAQARFNGYRWTTAQYLEVAHAHPWAWFSQMDLCCEPQIAPDAAEVRRRVEGTAEHLRRALLTLEDAGRSRAGLLPVLQGWRPDDYARSIALADAALGGRWPSLVGVGSVCRRSLRGDTGLLAVLAAVCADLPRGVSLHLFGVKGETPRVLAEERPDLAARVASVDSQAWDYAARRALNTERRAIEARTGRRPRPACRRTGRPADADWNPCSMAHRLRHLRGWLAAQEQPVPLRVGQRSLFELLEAA